MVNASFVFGMDGDDPSVFDRTVEWAIEHGIETATFHILTPYPGTRLYARMHAGDRLLHDDWDRYDTRQVVFRPAGMTVEQLETDYWRAYRDFYRWGSILRGAATKPTVRGKLRHLGYAAGWKKFEPAWDAVIRMKKAGRALPLLEGILSGFGRHRPDSSLGAEQTDRRLNGTFRLLDTEVCRLQEGTEVEPGPPAGMTGARLSR